MNLYGSNLQIWTQPKRKNAPKDQIKSDFNLNSNQNKKQMNQEKYY